MEDRYYTDSYYMGTEFYIEEPDDMLLETVPVSGDGYFYGFMLMDVRQNIYYTDFTGIETEDTGSKTSLSIIAVSPTIVITDRLNSGNTLRTIYR